MDPATLEHLSPQRPHRPVIGAGGTPCGRDGSDAGTHCRVGAPAQLEQQQQAASRHRVTGLEEAGAGQQSAGTLRQEAGAAKKGHPGETLCRTETPDAIIDHYPPACARVWRIADRGDGHQPCCAARVRPARAAATDRYRTPGARLPLRGVRSTDTGGVSWIGWRLRRKYGKRIGAVVLYLLHYQLLPEKRLATLMADLFGVRLATATIARISHDCAERFQGFANVVRDQVAVAPVKHMDETGFPDRRQDAMAAYRLDHAAHFLSGLGQARQPAGSGGRHRGARPLASLLHDDRRAAPRSATRTICAN